MSDHRALALAALQTAGLSVPADDLEAVLEMYAARRRLAESVQQLDEATGELPELIFDIRS